MSPIYEDAIQKVAAQLSSNITNDSDADSVRFDNGFEILNRSKYLIKWYIEELNKNPVPFSHEGDLEAGVRKQMELKLNFNDNWSLYLKAFDPDSETQSKDLEFMRLHQRTPSPSFSPTSPSFHPVSPSYVFPRIPEEDHSPPPEDDSFMPDSASESQDKRRKREEEETHRLPRPRYHPDTLRHKPPPLSLTREIRLLLTRLALYSRDE
jgi:hypothetical protein